MYRHIETYTDIQKAYTNCMSGLYLILRAILVSALKKIHSGELNFILVTHVFSFPETIQTEHIST